MSSPQLAFVKLSVLWLSILEVSSAVSGDRPGTGRGDWYDFIIAGGGAAGCTLARRLIEVDGWRVLLLEAGGEEPEWSRVPAYSSYTLTPEGNIDWGFRTVPSPESCGGVGCVFPRGKVLGGSTSTNGMFYVRGSRHDYDDWERMGNEGWGYDSVLKYFIKSENNGDQELAATKYHGSDGPLHVEKFPYLDVNGRAIIQALVEYNLTERDLNGEYLIGSAVTQMTNHHGERCSTNEAFLKPVRKILRLVVKTFAHVTRVLLRNKNRAYGVEYKWNNKTHRAYARKEVILSAGSICTPQILQLSGIGPRSILEPMGINVVADLPVGESLQDHPCSIAVTCNVNWTSQMPNITAIYDNFINYVQSRSGPLAGTGTLQIAAFFPPDNSTDEDAVPYMEMTFAPTTSEGTLPFSYYDKVYFVGILQKPKSKGYVRINSTDPLKHPLIQPNYFTEEPDMTRMVEGVRHALAIINMPALQQLGFEVDTTPIPGCENQTWGSDDYWRCAIRMTTRSNYHPVTTCKMGPKSDPTTVVDSELRVHGISNLRVMDASIMPTMISGHTMAPSIMIAEKGADFLIQRW